MSLISPFQLLEANQTNRALSVSAQEQGVAALNEQAGNISQVIDSVVPETDGTR